MAADDQLINLEVLKRQLTDLGLHEKCTYCIDGQQIIEKSKGVLEEAIAVAMAIIYNVDSVKLMEYARYRAQAMVLHDEAKLSRKAVDWDKIGSLLKLSFNSLSKNIQ